MLNDKQIAQAIMNAAADKKGRRLDKVLTLTVQWLEQERLISHWPKIRRVLEQLLRERDGRILVQVASRYPLGRTSLSCLSRWFKQHLGKLVEIEAATDETIIGGCKLIYGDCQLDLTVNHRLRILKKELLNK